MSKKTPPSGEPVVWTFHWLKWADSDYLAARCLLVGRMIVQGSALANTAIEKYLKALCAHLGLPLARSHATTYLYAAIKASKKSSINLNEQFLALLQKSYSLRYPDELTNGFNIALNEMKILAELDRTVFEITNSFKFDEGPAEFVLARAARTADKRYLRKNVVLNPDLATTFFNSSSQSFELRIDHPMIYDVEYLSPRVDDDGRFDQQGGVFISGKGIDLAFPRGEGKTILKPMFSWPNQT